MLRVVWWYEWLLEKCEQSVGAGKVVEGCVDEGTGESEKLLQHPPARSSSLSGAVDKHDVYEVDARSSSSCCYVECLSMWDLHRAISNQFWVPEIGVN
jgi:hypothetical protein